MIIVRAKIKEIADSEGRRLFGNKPFNVSRDFPEVLNAKVEAIVRESCERAYKNGRSTLMGKDV